MSSAWDKLAHGVTKDRTRSSVPKGFAEAAISLAVVTAVAFADGGYWPTAWGWVAIAAACLLAGGLVVRSVAFGPLDLIAVGALAALACWVALSSVWGSPSRAILEAERVVMYVVALGAGLVLIRRDALAAVVGGVWAGVSMVCGYALLTRVLPDQLGVFDPASGYRLSEPLGYWNGLGVFAASGFVLALGLSARAMPAVRVLAAASLPVLAASLYFTFSRGGWIALAVGLLAAIALDPRRLQLVTTLLALAPATIVGLLVAYRSPALSRVDSSLADASHAGYRLAAVLAGAVVVSALAALALQTLERRIAPTTRTRRWYATALVGAAMIALLVVLVRVGSPPTLVARSYDAFAGPPPDVGVRLERRLFSLSGSGRVPQWRVAWREFEREPVFGSGAGTYEQAWNELRPYDAQVRDAHSLYLETLAELGPLGLALLIAALGAPAFAATRARRVGLVPGVFGAYTVFVLHAGADWDWELPAVTLTALILAAALTVSARGVRAWPLSARTRVVVLAAALGVAAFSGIGLLGNKALADADGALRSGHTLRAAERARSALRWAPWSAEAQRLLAEAQLAEGDAANARANLRRAVAADPRDWTLWFALAQTTSGAERAAALVEARRLNPKSPEIRGFTQFSEGEG